MVTIFLLIMLIASRLCTSYTLLGKCRFSVRLLSTNNKDENFMKLALRQAQLAFRNHEVPVGAVIVDDKDTVLATSRNQMIENHDATSHAELDCVRKASNFLKQWRLSNCTLYTTLEPCPMCMGAIQAARIKRIVYAAKDIRLGAAGSFVDLTKSHPFHKVEVQGGVLQEESALLMRRFFIELRKSESSTSVQRE